MGSASKELAEPIENVDYYIMCYSRGSLVPRGWLQRREMKKGFTKEVVIQLIEAARRSIIKPCPDDRPALARRYYLYLGQKPEKSWGPVCP
jgi:hypothetical protein